MIRVDKKDEPTDFHARVREPGRRWMERGVEGTPACWRRVSRALREAFQHRCAYSAVWLSAPGTVDHFVSRDEDPTLAYEWSNYRYAAGWFNSRKGALKSSQLLDPCEIGDDWFEIVLPFCQLRMTEECPPAFRERALFMLKHFELDCGESVLRYRQVFYDMHVKDGLSLEALEKRAPLIARAVRKQMAAKLLPPSPDLA